MVREVALGDTELFRLEISSGLAVLLGVPCRTAGATSKFAWLFVLSAVVRVGVEVRTAGVTSSEAWLSVLVTGVDEIFTGVVISWLEVGNSGEPFLSCWPTDDKEHEDSDWTLFKGIPRNFDEYTYQGSNFHLQFNFKIV